MSGSGPGSIEPVETNDEAAATKARNAAREGFLWIRSESARLVENYKAQSRYFKWRSWIVGGYVLVALISIFIAMPPINTVKAYARVRRDDLDGRPLIYVRNDSSSEWKQVRIIINDQWVFERERLLPGAEVTANLSTFRKLNSSGAATKPPADVVAKTIRVKCDRGSFFESLE